MANEPKRIKWIIDALLDADLPEWESKFATSISDQFQRKGSLTDLQYDKLEEIYERRCQ